jgi:hypothetical protein
MVTFTFTFLLESTSVQQCSQLHTFYRQISVTLWLRTRKEFSFLAYINVHLLYLAIGTTGLRMDRVMSVETFVIITVQY